MLSQRIFDEVNQKLADAMASGPAKDIEKNFKAGMMATFAKLDLVTREEFEIQQGVLAKTREALTALEARIAVLEQRAKSTAITPNDAAENPQDEL